MQNKRRIHKYNTVFGVILGMILATTSFTDDVVAAEDASNVDIVSETVESAKETGIIYDSTNFDQINQDDVQQGIVEEPLEIQLASDIITELAENASVNQDNTDIDPSMDYLRVKLFYNQKAYPGQKMSVSYHGKTITPVCSDEHGIYYFNKEEFSEKPKANTMVAGFISVNGKNCEVPFGLSDQTYLNSDDVSSFAGDDPITPTEMLFYDQYVYPHLIEPDFYWVVSLCDINLYNWDGTKLIKSVIGENEFFNGSARSDFYDFSEGYLAKSPCSNEVWVTKNNSIDMIYNKYTAFSNTYYNKDLYDGTMKGCGTVVPAVNLYILPWDKTDYVENYSLNFYFANVSYKSIQAPCGGKLKDYLLSEEEINALIPDGCEFLGYYKNGTNTMLDPNTVITGWMNIDIRYIETNGKSARTSGRDSQLYIAERASTGNKCFDIYLVKGQTCTLPTTYSELNPSDERNDQTINWTASDKKYIKLIGKNKIKGVKSTGQSDSYVLYDGKTIDDSSYCCYVHVANPCFLRKTTTVAVGSNISLSVLGVDGKYSDAYVKTWVSSNPEVAMVEAGKVTGISKGNAKIIVYINGKAFTCTVKVSDTQKISKSYSNNSSVILSALQTANIKFSAKAFKSKNLTWVAEADDLVGYNNKGKPASDGEKISYYQNNIVRITPAGKVTAIGVGTTKLTATDSNGMSQVIRFRVDAPGEKILYIAKNKAKSVTHFNVKANSANWSSNNESVTGKIINGKVNGLEVGTAVVTCSYNPYNTDKPIEYKTTVYVEDAELPSDDSKLTEVNASKTQAKLTIAKGKVYALKVNGIYQQIIFNSANPSVVFVDELGIIYARGIGSTTISTKVNGKALAVKIYVTPPSDEPKPVVEDSCVIILADGTKILPGESIKYEDIQNAKFVITSSESFRVATMGCKGEYYAAKDPEPDWAYSTEIYKSGTVIALTNEYVWFSDNSDYDNLYISFRKLSNTTYNGDSEYNFHVIR